MKTTQPPLAYGTLEASEMIGISRARLYQLLAEGTLPSVKLGKRRLIRHDDLVALLDQHERHGAASDGGE